MSTKSKELCNTESENTALLGENSDKKEREKEKESESDILILNEPCEIIYSPEREEKEREKIESKPSNQLVKSPSHKGQWFKKRQHSSTDCPKFRIRLASVWCNQIKQ